MALVKCKEQSNQTFLEKEFDRLEHWERAASTDQLSEMMETAQREVDDLQTLVGELPRLAADLLVARVMSLQAQLATLRHLRYRKDWPPTPTLDVTERALEDVTPATSSGATGAVCTAAGGVFTPAFDKPNPRPFRSWAWDQTDSSVTVYLTVDGLQTDSQVQCEFTRQAFDFRCIECNGGHYRLAVAPLCEEVVPAECSAVVRPNGARIKLRKAQAGLEWSGLDDTEKRRREQHRRLAASGATTQELLRNMYEQADNKTREDLVKAAWEGQQKRADVARSGGYP